MATNWLKIPHFQQSNDGWCLPACVAMVTAYWQQPLAETDLARWLGTTLIGTPAARIERLAKRGFSVIYQIGSLAQLQTWLDKKYPCLLFVHTAELPYWQYHTPHVIVLAGLTNNTAYIFDPAFDKNPITVFVGDLLLAWSYSDYTYTVIYPETLG